MATALDRFLRYVRVETTSKEGVETVPSSPGQFELGRLLVEELAAMGLTDAVVDDHGYVMATLPDNRSREEQTRSPVPVVGMIAHLDTAPDAPGKDVQPTLVDYRGGAVTLKSGKVIPESDALARCRGDLLVVTDGTTLLGADDKAGIAAIMTALDRLAHEKIEGKPHRHGKIRVCFTPDEEVGRGTDFFDLERFGADCAFTVDGELPGAINKETFSAEKLTLKIEGVDIHPGTAKGVMVNAAQILADFLARLPKNRAPETTEGREPYLHPYSIQGDVGRAEAQIILRGFTDADMAENRRILDHLIEEVRKANPKGVISADYRKQYPNMAARLAEVPDILAKLEEAVRRAGVEPVWQPIRGGTDGSVLTEKGLPTPNIFTGGYNFHGVTEWLSVNKMEIAVRTLVLLAELFAETSDPVHP